MDKGHLGIRLLKIGTIIYTLVIFYRIITGTEHYWSSLIMPLLAVLALWKPHPAGRALLRGIFSVQFLIYAFSIVRGIIWIELQWASRVDLVLYWTVMAGICLAAAIFVHKRKELFGEESAGGSRFMIIGLLALSILVLPWIERTAWLAFDPRILQNEMYIGGLQFSPDSKKLGVINGADGNSSIAILDVDSKKFTTLGVENRKVCLSSLSFSSDGKYVAAGYTTVSIDKTDDVKVVVWELASEQKMRFKREAPFDFSRNTVTDVYNVAFSPDGAYLACVAGNDYRVLEIWDVHTGTLTKAIAANGSAGGFYPLAYSPDGKYLASRSAQASLVIWDVAAGVPVQKLANGYLDYYKGMAYSPDGRYLISAINKRWPGSKAGTDKGFIDIWETTTGRLTRTLDWESDSRIFGMAVSPDGRYIASYIQLQDSIDIWDVASGKKISKLRGPVIGSPVNGVAYSPDGRYLAVSSERYIKLYDAREPN